jgi:hypothetical protein
LREPDVIALRFQFRADRGVFRHSRGFAFFSFYPASFSHKILGGAENSGYPRDCKEFFRASEVG